MSTGLLACVALLGALAGLAAPHVARRHAQPGPPTGTGPGLPVLAGGAGVGAPAGVPGAGPPVVSGAGEAGPPAGLTAVVGAVVFAGLAAALGADPALPAFLGLAAVGLVLALVDLSCLRLPDPLVGAAATVTVVGLGGAALVSGTPGRLLGAVAGGALCFAGHVLLALLPGSRLGFGDVKLAAVLGLPLGWLGWSYVGLGLLLPHLLNGVVVLALLLTGRVRRDTPLPLGPALLTATWLTTLTPTP
ncbi:A24 family peptidase [Micromonospora sp. NPDC047074]|uniref:A24 family peptidase n=1 Tax=Micromonospora sp. NPDC047074 TaxID=3154339 RepID=UPI0033E598D2